MGEIAGVLGLANTASSLLGGSKGGGGNAGLTAQQAALAQYEGDQQQIANAQKFGSSGMGHSTGLTYADAGSQLGAAEKGSQMADINALGQNNLQQMAQNAGFTSTGSFGTSGGDFGGSTNTTPDVSSG